MFASQYCDCWLGFLVAEQTKDLEGRWTNNCSRFLLIEFYGAYT